VSAEIGTWSSHLTLFVVNRDAPDCYWIDRLTGRWEWRRDEPRGYSIAGYSISMEWEEPGDWDDVDYAREVVCGCWRFAETRTRIGIPICVLDRTADWSLKLSVAHCCWS
jgi:hypothetical protein